MGHHLSEQIKTRLNEIYMNWARKIYEPWLVEMMKRNNVPYAIMISDFYRACRTDYACLRGNQFVHIVEEAAPDTWLIINSLKEFHQAITKKIPIPLNKAKSFLETVSKVRAMIVWESSDMARWSFIEHELETTIRFYQEQKLSDTFRGIPTQDDERNSRKNQLKPHKRDRMKVNENSHE